MSEMVERVARAIYGEIDQRGEAYKKARAAIEAMREATDEMLKAAAANWDDDWCSETNALNMWQAMIDEALK